MCSPVISNGLCHLLTVAPSASLIRAADSACPLSLTAHGAHAGLCATYPHAGGAVDRNECALVNNTVVRHRNSFAGMVHSPLTLFSLIVHSPLWSSSILLKTFPFCSPYACARILFFNTIRLYKTSCNNLQYDTKKYRSFQAIHQLASTRPILSWFLWYLKQSPYFETPLGRKGSLPYVD